MMTKNIASYNNLALVRHMTAATAAVTLVCSHSGCAMYWEGFTLAMCYSKSCFQKLIPSCIFFLVRIFSFSLNDAQIICHKRVFE